MNSEILPFLQQHWELSLAFIVIALYWLISEIASFSRGQGINPRQLVDLLNHSNATILDLRPLEAFQQGHILHAQHVPPAQLNTYLEKLKNAQTKPLILVDAQGTQVYKPLAICKRAGFKECVYLKNGMHAWQQAQLPLHKGN